MTSSHLQVADRLSLIKPSATLAVAARAAALRAAGQDVIGLGAGEPDFPTPEHICTAATRAMAEGQTKYTAVDGTAALKQAVIEKFKRDNNLHYAPENIIVSTGAKQSLFNLLQALINPGDEVIIPAPCWVSYPDMVQLAEGQPVPVMAGSEQHFRITPEQLEQAITARTRLLMLNAPNNPTGMGYSKDQYRALGEVLQRHPQVAISSDEIYEPICWAADGFVSFASACPELIERSFIVNGVSKAYAMTGWRIGYLAGDATLVKAMKKLQSQSTSNACSIAQAAAVAALEGDQQCVRDMCAAFKRRHDWLIPALNDLPHISCLPADGAFYALPDCSAAIARIDSVDDDLQFSEWLLEQAQLAVVPGSAFMAPGHVRMSYATSMDNLQQAVARLQQVLENI